MCLETSSSRGSGRRSLSFFFSSRRRHTRLQGDWSSDVCSSDLALGHLPAIAALYEDPEVAKARPEIAAYKRMLPDLVVRPSAQTRDAYGRVSASLDRKSVV